MTNETRRWDYDFAGYDDTGIIRKIDVLTGEVVDTGTLKPVWSKDRVLSAEQLEAQKKWKEQQEQKRLEEEAKKKRRKTATEMGAHYFVDGAQSFGDLAPATATRLIFLATYCGYSDQGNKLMRTTKTQMHKEDLANVLKVSRTTAERFLDEVSPRYVIESKEGLLSLNEDIFVKGALDRQSSHYRVYAHWVRTLYNATEKSKHKLLGHLFRMLPHINIEYNVLCHNPLERDFDLVDILTLDEFLDKIGYNKSNRHILIKIYDNLVFPVGDHMERFCSVVFNGVRKDIGKSKLFMNPNILYSGSRIEEVRILGKFCKT